MKKCFTLLCAFLAVSMTALAETEHLPLVAAGGAEVIDPNPPAVQNGLPARVTIPGNWGDVKLYNGSFDATTYVGCSVTLARPFLSTFRLRSSASGMAFSVLAAGRSV